MGGSDVCVAFHYESMDVEAYVSASRIELYIKNFVGRQQLLLSVNERKTAMGAFSPLEHAFSTHDARVFSNGLADEAVIRFCQVPENEEDIARLRLNRSEYLLFAANGIWLGARQSPLDSLQERLSILERLFERNRKRTRSPIFYEEATAILPQGTRSESTPHFFGGQLPEMPACHNCATPLHLLATIDLTDPSLGFPGIGEPILRIAACLNCDAITSPLFLSYAGGGLRVLHQDAGQRFGDLPRILTEQDVKLEPNRQSLDEKEDTPRHQLGGSPTWIQGIEAPSCIECGNAMPFIAQLDTDRSVGMQFGDDGILYVFICTSCRVLASFAQSH
ncbi:MAG: DUF1963 domain-containing protein [Sedimentisphaerales bacterium]|nr:DUF1963 domain-containing protein [Sedimentisphaerales bacterium]